MSKLLRTGMLVLAMALPFAPLRLDAQETTIKGLLFGDYYSAVGHHDTNVADASGFWVRRLYLTFNSKFSSSWDSRVRFEAASSGDFETPGKVEPFLKDMWIRWKSGRHSIVLGLSASPTWDAPEHEWGYRDLEKTPMDLFKLGSSRDFGIAFKGAFDEAKRVEYHFMVGNGSGAKTETDQGKKYAAALILHPTANVTLHAYADHEDRAGTKDRNTYELFGSVKGEKGRIGAMWVRQAREQAGADNLTLDVVSGYAVLNANDRVNLVARVDRTLDPNPDAAKISYFRMAPTSKATFFVAGVDIAMEKGVHLIPNLEMVTYDDSALDSDVFLKTTFSIKF